jgi:hypothetical protein
MGNWPQRDDLTSRSDSVNIVFNIACDHGTIYHCQMLSTTDGATNILL